MTDYATGVTTSVGLWDGGTGANVVPEFSTFEVDVRLPDAATAETVCARLAALKQHDPDVKVEATGGLNRPAFAQSAASTSRYKQATVPAAWHGYPLQDTVTGRTSDGNINAELQRE